MNSTRSLRPCQTAAALLFSATFSSEIRLAVLASCCRDPLLIDIQARRTLQPIVRQWIIPVDRSATTELFIHLLRREQWGQYWCSPKNPQRSIS